MKKLFKILIVSILCAGVAKLCHAFYVIRIQKPENSFILDPIKMQQKQQAFQRMCPQQFRYRKYGNPKLIESLDTGRIRPGRRRQIRHQTLDKLKEQFDGFPHPTFKQQAIQNLKKRIIILKKCMY